MIRFILNEKPIATDQPPGMVLLDLIRYQQHLTGTKIGCREGDCGACTILVGELVDGEMNYQSMTSCLMPLANAHGKHIVTIEGINLPSTNGNGELNLIQQAMADEGATQCGFCTPGFVMSMAGFSLSNKTPTRENAIASIDGNICRCTGYKSIERAAERLAKKLNERKENDRIGFIVQEKILPAYFTTIREKLRAFENGEMKPAAKGLPLLGGGTDLYVQKHEELVHAELDFIFNKPALKGVYKEGNRCMIGGAATVTDLKESALFNEIFPAFQRYAKLISSTPIRNMATVAGNFINASPIGDLSIFFLVLDANLVLTDGSRTRELPLRKLYKGYKTLDKLPEEQVEKIWFDLPASNQLFHFEKVSKRQHLDIATVNTAISLKVEGKKISAAHISAGGVGPIPMLLEKSAALLAGKTPDPEIIDELVKTAMKEISPISDARGSMEYKSLLLGQLIRAHFNFLFPAP